MPEAKSMGSKLSSFDRRDFLKAAVVGAATAASGSAIHSTTPGKMADPAPPAGQILTTDRPGSDFMVDVLKSLEFEYVCANPGSSFRGLHESVINYGSNKSPELITCCHEESAVAMAHGYAKIAGKPLCVLAHGTVGLQHAAMAIYNAYCDRVPVYIIIGNTIDATMRRPGAEWSHSVQDAAAMVRDYVKWDDLPISLQHFAESAVRAYKISVTPPMLPVLLVADSELQENPAPANADQHIPRLTIPQSPVGDSGAVSEAAKLLLEAENPVIVVDHAARTQAGMERLVELASFLQAPVIDQYGRMNFPSRHPLNQTSNSRALIASADVILGLELSDYWGTVHSFKDQLHRTSQQLTKPGAKLISVTSTDLYIKSNYQDFQRAPELDVAIAADAEATVPSLIEVLRQRASAGNRDSFRMRGAKMAASHQAALEKAQIEATYGWNASPISVARMCAELWEQIKGEDWSLVSYIRHSSWWPLRLWSFEKYYQFIGGSGGYGMGYNAPASVGAALANRKHGRLTVNIQDDGDLMYAPGVLWTAAHHQIPILNIMHNNRAYHEELMHVQRMANRHNRGIDRAGIGTLLDDPSIDFAKLGQSMGVYAEGPIADPAELAPAIRRAIAVVKKGQPAIVDVVTQPR
jgi:acetolactate synthase I/II/III large subunit